MQTDRQPATHCVRVCHSFYPAMMGGPNCDHDEVETYDLAALSPGDALKWRGEGGRWKPLVFVGADDDGIDIRYGDSVTQICYGGGHHCDTDGHDYCRFELYVSVD